MTNGSEMPPSLITLTIEAVRTSESKATFYELTRRNIPEVYHLLKQIINHQLVRKHDDVC
jgi:hypothetical protein